MTRQFELESLPPIEELVPHKGSMCLWQRVEMLEEERIQCWTQTHLNANHPLSLDGEPLSIMALIEYAAQSVAVHGGALAWFANGDLQVREGFLVSVRNTEFFDFNRETSCLRVEAVVLMVDDTSKSYSFKLTDAEQNMVCQGRVMVVHFLKEEDK